MRIDARFVTATLVGMEWKSIRTNKRHILVVLVAVLGLAVVTFLASKQFESATSRLTVINGITVPPEPDPELNNATLAGIDSNQDGVRDDIERLIAREFGTDPKKFAFTTSVAKAMQAMFIAPSRTTERAYDDTVRCVFDNTILEDAVIVERAMLSTGPRNRLYGELMAGTSGDMEGCEEMGINQIDSEAINGVTVPPELGPELNGDAAANVIPGVTFELPHEWSVVQGFPDPLTIRLLSPATRLRRDVPDSTNIPVDVLIRMLPNPKGLSIEDFVESVNVGVYEHRTALTVSGRPAIRLSAIESSSFRAPAAVVYVSHPDGSVVAVSLQPYPQGLTADQIAGFEAVIASLSFE